MVSVSHRLAGSRREWALHKQAGDGGQLSGGKEAVGAYEIVGSLRPASSGDRCHTHGHEFKVLINLGRETARQMGLY